MTNYFLPRHLGIEPAPKKKARTRIRSKPKSHSAIVREQAYRAAVRLREFKVAAIQQGVPEKEADTAIVYCEFCWPKKLHVYDDPHHTAGRYGTNMYDVEKLRLICRRIHNKVHADPKWAESVGLRVK